MADKNENQAGCGAMVLLVVVICAVVSFLSNSERTRRPEKLPEFEMPKLPDLNVPKMPTTDFSTWSPNTTSPIAGDDAVSTPRPVSTLVQTGGPGQFVVAFDNRTGETALVLDDHVCARVRISFRHEFTRERMFEHVRLSEAQSEMRRNQRAPV